MTDYSKEFIKTLCSKINKVMTKEDIDELFELYLKSKRNDDAKTTIKST